VARILFVQNIWIEYYGVMQITSVLREHGHEVDILFADNADTVAYIKKTDPDVIGYSCMSIQWDWAKQLAECIKSSGLKQIQIIGGIHATMYPELTAEHQSFDAICIGEGEYPMLELCDALDAGADWTGIGNIWARSGDQIIKNPNRPKLRQQELDKLPFADRELYRKYKHFLDYPFAIFVGSRGCPFQCSFCEVPEVNSRYGGGKSVYYRSVDSLLAEINWAKEAGYLDGRLVMFTDSTFNSHKKWLLEFLKGYEERIDVPFSCNLRVDLINEQQVRALKTAGCDNVRFGVESGDEAIRNTVLKKALTDEKLFSSAKILRKYQIPYITFNLFGNPGETYDQAWKTIYTNQRLNPTAMGAYIFVLFPGISATNDAIRQGLIDEGDLPRLDEAPYNLHLSLLVLHPERSPEITRICNLQKFAIIVTRYPRLEGLVRQLCKLPPLEVFGTFYSVCQAWEWKKWSTKTTTTRIMFEALLNYQALVLNGKEGQGGGVLGRVSSFLIKRKRAKTANWSVDHKPGPIESFPERKITH
jgi:anaerobic magnesium-protoporphyrin IX monomethyl ester cyclase